MDTRFTPAHPAPRTALHRRLWLAACVSLIGLPAWAQDAKPADGKWPTHMVRFVAAGPAGSISDTLTRALADHMSRALGQTVIVDNKPGANSAIGASEVARSAPDGHTLLMTNSSSITVNPQLYRKLSYKAESLLPVTPIIEGQFVLAVNPAWAKANKIESAKDLIAWAKAHPGKLRYASAGLGNLAHLTFAMLGNKEGFEAIHVPYKGQAPAQMALMAGEVEAMFDIPNSAPNFETGKIKPLAITAPKRVARLPNVPTMTEAGYPVDVNYWMGVFVPAGTPPAVVSKVNEALRAATHDPKVRTTLTMQGDVLTESADAFGKRIAKEIPQWGAVIQREKIEVD
ncbi:ABC transporter substrate-binding protein [Comamonas serinivorans]|uniref:ABC transporter substrate-binding protein n=1 Tax=Comamonas serinivorans TaxID=1082851 RepID=A0A1Y0EIT1_9BURK|nr:tripartite tricarboxylate transporter substrate binding protein [Comamonas serinivorans]ARU03544.1 ABC transporter substrate-binding protein [Comamonas serinivorans]